ncbi:MAG: flagellar protein FliS [Clostridia bacterium]|jgi:flagellar secretion chaperone FliS|nr:flagellar protein FliS [Clostridia bacterium]HKM22994.1 flagellar protein FliS [Lachnospiraceae bacterium]
MTKEQIQRYTLRITQANRSQIIVILYDMILDDVTEASECYDDYDSFKKACNHITRCTADLMEALDFSYEVSFHLMQIYQFINRQVSTAVLKKEPAVLKYVASAVTKLKEAFEEVSKQDSSGPMMENTQTVYAGLTYSKSDLTEDLRDQGSSRGFRV